MSTLTDLHLKEVCKPYAQLLTNERLTIVTSLGSLLDKASLSAKHRD